MMKAYQVVLVDSDGAYSEEHVTPKVFLNKEKADAYKQFFLDEDRDSDFGWFDVYVKEVELVE